MRGEIDNFDFQEATLDRSVEDTAVEKLSLALWFSYDDLKRHPISVDKKGWQALKRCMAFLETDLEWSNGPSEAHFDEKIWPFPTWRSLYENRGRFSRPVTPRYNAAIHNVPIRTPAEKWAMKLRSILFLGMLASLLVYWVYSMIH